MSYEDDRRDLARLVAGPVDQMLQAFVPRWLTEVWGFETVQFTP